VIELKKQIAMRIRRNILQEKIEQIRQDNRRRKFNSELNLHKILRKLSSSGTEYDKENEN
jgi:hypothetical protein